MATKKKVKKVEEETTSLPAVRDMGMGGLGGLSTTDLLSVVETDGADQGSATGADIREGMGNVRAQLEVVKIKGHGANLFLFGDDSKVDGDVGITGIVVAYTRHNSYFDSPFGETEAGVLPPCFSNDGVTVAPNAEVAQSEGGCASCPRNRDAKDPTARNAAFEAFKTQSKESPEVCTNYISLAVALPGRDVPVRIRFTAQAFKEWARYIQEIGTVRGRFLPHEVVTCITLENRDGGHGEYSVPKFTYKGALPVDLRAQFTAQRDSYRALLQRAAEGEERDASASDEAKSAAASAKVEATEAASSGTNAGL